MFDRSSLQGCKYRFREVAVVETDGQCEALILAPISIGVKEQILLTARDSLYHLIDQISVVTQIQ